MKVIISMLFIIIILITGCETKYIWPENNINNNALIEELTQSDLFGKNMLKINLNEVGNSENVKATWKDDNTIIFITVTNPEILTDSKDEYEKFQQSIDWNNVFIQLYEYKIDKSELKKVFETSSEGNVILSIKILNNKDIVFKTAKEFIILSGIGYTLKNRFNIPVDSSSDAEISPDGKFLAYIPSRIQKTICFMEIETKKEFNIKIEESEFIDITQWNNSSTALLISAPSSSEVFNGAAIIDITNKKYKNYEFNNGIGQWATVFLCKDMLVIAESADVDNKNIIKFECFKTNGEKEIINAENLIKEGSYASYLSVSSAQTFAAINEINLNDGGYSLSLLLYDFFNEKIIKTEYALQNYSDTPPVFNEDGSKVLYMTKRKTGSDLFINEPYIIYLN